MLDRNHDGLSQETFGAPGMGGRARVTKSPGRTADARAAPAFLKPAIWERVKENLMYSGVFPPEAELAVQETAGDATLISCSWLLLDDPDQPDRRSTPIMILIHGDLADQFHIADPEIFRQLNAALVRVVARRMKRYRDDLGLPFHRPPPPLEIRVGIGHIGWVGPNGK
jgi:hypothetical protein